LGKKLESQREGEGERYESFLDQGRNELALLAGIHILSLSLKREKEDVKQGTSKGEKARKREKEEQGRGTKENNGLKRNQGTYYWEGAKGWG